MNGFDEAQRYYDAAMPPEEWECPDCGGEEYDLVVEDCPHGFYQDSWAVDPNYDDYFEDY